MMKPVLFVSTLLLTTLALAKPVDAPHADLKILNEARRLYAQKKYEQAEEKYSQIPKTSEYWPLAIEERAHTRGRAGRYHEALADLTTLFSPVFEASLGPEPYFTAALTYLRLCQYSKIFDVIQKYKANMRARVEALMSIRDGAARDLVTATLRDLKEQGVRGVTYAANAHRLPSLVHLDRVIYAELKKAKPDFTVLHRRFAEVAEQDLNEIQDITKKMHLVEAEVMQRLHLAESKGKNRQRMGLFKQQKNQLVFPYDGEVWIDELDSYQVQVEQCPQAGV